MEGNSKASIIIKGTYKNTGEPHTGNSESCYSWNLHICLMFIPKGSKNATKSIILLETGFHFIL